MIVSMMPKAPILSRDTFPGFLSKSSLRATDGPSGGPRLIVVSNRVSVPNPRGGGGAGGLAVALEAALRASGGIWFGWSGEARAAIDADSLHMQQSGPVTFATTDLTRRDVDDYYLGFSNRALWPVCHYRLDLARFSDRETQAYFRVNDLFARKLAGLVQPTDLIWVHDYHLIPLGAALRGRGLGNRIGFFLHIPWPPPEVISALPRYRRLLEGLLAYDVVGFQTERDASHFQRCVLEEGLATSSGEGLLTVGERQVQVAAFPIGIDTAGIAAAAEKSVGLASTKRMLASIEGKRLLIGVDRLDYSKGLRERIRSFVAYLTTHQEERGRVSYLQITPKSRSEVPEYAELERDVATQVGEANGAYGDFDWTPIRYVNQSVPHATLMGLYRMADVGLVTPLRDGMNLVAKEYVASQDPENPGVLVLSRYAGAAFELEQGALLVNPYDSMATAGAIDQALRMSRGERRDRWQEMMRVLEGHTVNDWWQSFLGALRATDPMAAPSSGNLGATG
ncbi:trehalose-6-phosphate synthase [Enterovirga sp.]|uniref:alpha,alpha-trehalose-phosphate synthase (UDP-forming) n=1 Tax=Enterovirga sp. TaxID=2026350 RepID=UPI002CF5B5F5|nr:trehalose-6-phosphate synthase [Enterovirga sp.]HMO28992.1 trehalose-6-phosphate synthase [Enterovirga sp.]